MTAPATPAPGPPVRIPVPLWSWLLAAAALIVVYLLLQENGILLASTAELVHELAHDGRHALGVPCH